MSSLFHPNASVAAVAAVYPREIDKKRRGSPRIQERVLLRCQLSKIPTYLGVSAALEIPAGRPGVEVAKDADSKRLRKMVLHAFPG
jgi:hypothetical protein